MNYCLINKMTVKPDMRDEVVKIMLEAGQPFNDNPNCFLYLLSESIEDENVIWVQDIWKDQKSHQAAMETPEMMQFVKKSIPLLECMPEQFEIKPVGGKSDWA